MADSNEHLFALSSGRRIRERDALSACGLAPTTLASMTAISVRTFTPHEWEALRDLRLEALSDTPWAFSSTADHESRFDETTWRARTITSAAALRDGVPVGLVGWHQSDPTVARLELVSMWVRSDARGSTVASRLVDHVLAVAGTERELVLGIMADNARARAFYERVGFIMSVESIAEVHPQCLIRMVFPR